MTVAVIPLTPDDWRTWRSMRIAALAEAPEAFSSRFADWVDADEGRWRDRLSIPGAVDFVALASPTGAPVGMVTGTPPVSRDADGAELISMWVAPTARGQGVARALIDAVVDWAVADGARYLSLSVMPGNEAARRMYERNGFEIVVEPRDGPELRMRRAL